jgi:membrane-bound lytic murein transglycosylase D
MKTCKILFLMSILYFCQSVYAQENKYVDFEAADISQNIIENSLPANNAFRSDLNGEKNMKNFPDFSFAETEINDDSAALKIARAISKARVDKKTSFKISEAEELYKKAFEYFKSEDFEKSKKYFNFFLKEIERSAISPEVYFFIFDDIENMLVKLKSIYGGSNSYELSKDLQWSIPMTIKDNELVEKYISIYSNGKPKERVQSALERSGAYRRIVLKNLKDFNLPEELFYLPVIESLYNINAVSKAGAVGMWQIMAHRGRALGLKINYWIDERKDPEKSTQAACLYLKQLYIMLNDWHLVLAAYNRGEYGLVRDMKFSNAANISEMVSRKAVPKETQNYVPQFIAAATIGKNLKKYGFDDLNFDQVLQYDKYITNVVIDLKIIAQCAETTVEEIKKLNPALNAWCTPHGYSNFEVKIPYGSKTKFLENLKLVKDLNPSPGFIKHRVAKGDYLDKIAKTYKTTIKEIYANNPNLASRKTLRVGEIVIIRPGKGYFR